MARAKAIQSTRPAVLPLVPPKKNEEIEKLELVEENEPFVLMCTKGNHVVPRDMFHKHPKLTSHYGLDFWCKHCVETSVTNKATLREYCWYNNRVFKDIYWENALQAARLKLSKDMDYISSSARKKKEIETKEAIDTFFKTMNKVSIYGLSDNIREDHFVPFPGSVDEEEEDDFDERIEGVQNLIYSPEWNGHYSSKDLEYLNQYYKDLENDFVLGDRSIRDYARKIAKASLDVDILQDKCRRGEGDFKELKQAQDTFDKFSQSAMFAQCKRQPGQATGMARLGEIILNIELMGLLNTAEVHFPEDDVDKILADFSHVVAATGIGDN